jgi:histidine triad (HIT) family protein
MIADSNSCIFCQILSGAAPASMVYRDRLCSAFMDIQPVNPGHVLVIPNEHATYLKDLKVKTGGHLFQIAMQIAAAIRKCGVQCEGVNIFLADGEAAMQVVPHVHLHVVPRFSGDRLRIQARDDLSKKPARFELDQLAENIKERL